ncbi:MAG: sulfate reduction electron transfer complex DsrMKJOP subunit DsrM [Candidatus Krumholzibacteriia bacterium]
MKVLIALGAVALLSLVAFGAGAQFHVVFGVVLPGVALAVFVVGLIVRVVNWARTPVPFKITTTCGQQKSLAGIEYSALDCPPDRKHAFLRMALEVLFFRSLFRNTRASLTRDERRLVYGSSKWLWLFAIMFHYAFLVVVIRHLRFFMNPVPGFVDLVDRVDGMFEIGVPGLYITSALLIGALGFLLVRRLYDAQVRFMSLTSDYFALFLLLGIAVSGAVLRYTPLRVDIVQVKQLAMGIWTMNPMPVEGASGVFYVHLFLVSVLLAYFPFSKLVHAPGIFFSPTRNLPNDNRAVRHVNPWAQELPNRTHSYAAWEREWATQLEGAGFELEAKQK